MKTPIEQRTRPPRVLSRVRSLSALCLVTLFSFGPQLARNDAVAGQAKPAARPVILLTGFEPFGEGRPPNSSWEGIKQLDGQVWNGYQLVCKQVPVVWGAPLEQLQTLIPQHQPAAIFSFGQGMPGAFAFETRASNQRGRSPDNKGEAPPAALIVEDGPKQLSASMDCEKLARRLADKGHEVRVSTGAGRYLCEEMLYSLEYVKSTKQLKAPVVFCHVPPLDTPIRGKKVTAEYVQQFVVDTLEAWHTDQEVREFIGRYFRTWSDQDMKSYDSCFLPDAGIQHIDSRGRLSTYSRSNFISSQRDYHRNAPHKTTEVPNTIDIRFEQKLARVVVHWTLTAGPRTESGYDHFTLMKHEGNWRIVNLVFYTAPAGEKP